MSKQKRKLRRDDTIQYVNLVGSTAKTILGAGIILLFVFALSILIILFTVQPLILFWQFFVDSNSAVNMGWTSAITLTFVFFLGLLGYFVWQFDRIDKQYQQAKLTESQQTQEPNIQNLQDRKETPSSQTLYEMIEHESSAQSQK